MLRNHLRRIGIIVLMLSLMIPLVPSPASAALLYDGNGKRLPDAEIDELQRIIDGMRG